jgi:glycosyltransferase involved in cell wall biosynthesis
VELIESMVDVVEFISQLDVFVSASHSEAFGLAIVDAMACGIPVVATATGGAGEIISDGQTGRLTPIGDIDELANRIVELLDDPQLRDRLSTNARAMVAERFSAHRMISQTEDVYRAVLSD